MSRARTPLRAALVRAFASAATAALLLAGCAGTLQQPDDSQPAAASQPEPTAPSAEAMAAWAAEADAELVLVAPKTEAEEAAARGDLWDRVRGGYDLPRLEGKLVQQWEQWYASRPDYVDRMTERGGRYLFYILEEVERRGLPAELALLPFVESAFNPQAYSHAAAAGLWQFMPGTGRDFDLGQNVFRDDRRDVLASTRAALDYLTQLHERFGDWQLALAAYNCGPGNVQRAIRTNQARGLPTDYASLKLPVETRNYVPKLQAMMNIVLKPEDYGIELPALENHPFFMSVPIERDIDLALAAQLAELDLEEFKALNPQITRPVILAAGTPQVLLPYDNANTFLRALQAWDRPLASWTAWVAPKNLTPKEAARMTGMDEAEFREVNAVPPRMLVKAGSTLVVPRADSVTEDVSEQIANNGAMNLAPESPAVRKIVLRVGRRGDSVESIARRYRLDAAHVAEWNHVKPTASFRANQRVTLLVPAPAKASSKVSKVAKGGKGAKATRVAKGKAPAKAVKTAKAGKSKPAAKTAAKAVPKRTRVAEGAATEAATALR